MLKKCQLFYGQHPQFVQFRIFFWQVVRMHQQQENLKFMSHFPHGLIIKQVPTGRKFGRITQNGTITYYWYYGTVLQRGPERGGRNSLAGLFFKIVSFVVKLQFFTSCFKTYDGDWPNCLWNCLEVLTFSLHLLSCSSFIQLAKSINLQTSDCAKLSQ